MRAEGEVRSDYSLSSAVRQSTSESFDSGQQRTYTTSGELVKCPISIRYPRRFEQAVVAEEQGKAPFLNEWDSSRRTKEEFQNEEIREHSL